MAFQETVGKLIVRLLGEDSQYQRMLTRVSKTTLAVGKKLTKYLTVPLLAVAAASVKAFADFDQAMTQSMSIMDKLSDKQVARMKQLALDLSTKGTKGPIELAESYYFLASAGLNAEASMRALPIVSKFATAGAFDMALATDLLTDAQTALGSVLTDNSKTMEDLGDHIVLAARQANASVQQFAESITADAGVAARTFGMEIETLMGVLGAYASSGKKAAEAGNLTGRALRLLTKSYQDNAAVFKRMGIEVIDKNTGEFRNFIKIIEDMEKAFEGLTRPQISEKLRELGFEALAQKSILPLIGMSDAMGRWEEEQRKAGGTTEAVFNKQMESLTNQVKQLWNQLKVLAIEIGSTLAPTIRKWTDDISKLVKWFRQLNPSTKSFILSLAKFLAILGPTLIVTSKLVSLFNLLSAGTAAANAGLYGLATVAIAALVVAIYKANTSIAKFNQELAESIRLSDELAQRQNKRHSKAMELAGQKSGADQVAEYKKLLDQAKTEVKGLESQVKLAKADLAFQEGRDNQRATGLGVQARIMKRLPFVNAKQQAFSRKQVEETEKKLRAAMQKRQELETAHQQAVTAMKAQQNAKEDEAAVAVQERLEYFKSPEAKGLLDNVIKKTKLWGTTIDFEVLSRLRGVKRQAAAGLSSAGKFLSGGYGRGSQDYFRVNRAVQGGTMEAFSAQEMTAKFVAENRKKPKEEDTQAKQLDTLNKIEEHLKKGLTPYSGIASLFETVGGD